MYTIFRESWDLSGKFAASPLAKDHLADRLRIIQGGKACPAIYKNLGVKDGIPCFREDAFALVDFPTAEDKAIKRSGPLFDKILKEKKRLIRLEVTLPHGKGKVVRKNVKVNQRITMT